jgi:Bacterial PH domain
MNTIEETIKLAGWGRRKAMTKQIEAIGSKIGTIMAVVASQPKPTEQIYVTRDRVVFHKIAGIFGNETKEILIKNITSINVEQKFVWCDIEITASGSKIKAEKLPAPIAMEVKRIIDILREGQTIRDEIRSTEEWERSQRNF